MPESHAVGMVCIEGKAPQNLPATGDYPFKETRDEITRVLEGSTPWEIPNSSCCRVLTHKRDRYLSHVQYEKLLARAEGFDLFIDGITKQACSRNGAKKGIRRERLTPAQYVMLGEYIVTRKIMRPVATTLGKKLASAEAALKLFEKARRKVDVKVGRYRYRSFRLLKATCREANAFEFSPPKDLRFCLIVPIHR
jgi:hypothetical protein